MVDASADRAPADVDGGYRQIGWRGTRREISLVARWVVALVPGIAVGLWLARDISSDYLAGWVVVLCGLTTVAVGGAGWQPLQRLRRRPGPAPEPRMLRTRIGDEVALVTPPSGGSLAACLAVVTGLVLAIYVGSLLVGADVTPSRPGLLLPVIATILAMTAAPVLAPLDWLRGPSVAMFADRVEIRRSYGRYVIAWPAVVQAALDGTVPTIYVASPSAVRRVGWIRRPEPYGVRIDRDLAVPASVVIDAIERLRRAPLC